MVRSNFLGCMILLLLSPLFFVVSIAPHTIPYLVGIIVPFILLSVACFVCKTHMLNTRAELIKNNQAWVGVIIFFVIGLVLNILMGINIGVAWYLSAVCYLLLTDVGQIILALCGLREYSNENDVIR